MRVDEAKRIGDSVGVDWKRIDLEQFRRGLEVESEHKGTLIKMGVRDIKKAIASIVVDHLNEWPDYYDRLKKVER